MSADFFSIAASKPIVEELDAVARTRSSRVSVFHDWLRMIAAALTGGREESWYLETVKRYTGGKDDAPKRLANAWGAAHAWMRVNPFGDILGDIFQGGITRGEAGQFFTPNALCEVMATLAAGDLPERTADAEPLKIADPACGSGRTLLAFARSRPNELYFATDVDERCVLMTAINLAVNGVVGAVVHGNTLSLDVWGGWLAGFDGVGYLRRLTPDEAYRCIASGDRIKRPAPAPEPADEIDDETLAKELGLL